MILRVFWVFNDVLLKVSLKNSFFILKKFTFDFTHYFMSSVTHTFPHGLSAHGFYAQKYFFCFTRNFMPNAMHSFLSVPTTLTFMCIITHNSPCNHQLDGGNFHSEL